MSEQITPICARSCFVARLRLGLILAASAALLAAATSHTAQAQLRSHRQEIALLSRAPVGLNVVEQGRGRPVLLLHGLGASSYMWRRLMPALARDYRVIAVDLKGFGRSDKPVDFSYRIEEHTALIRALIVKLDLRDLTLIGHSFGGAVALLLALDLELSRDPRIARLVLMNSPAFPQRPSAGVAFLRKPLIPYLALNILPPEFAAQAALTSIGGDRSFLSPGDVAAYAQPFMERGARHALIETGRGIEPENFEALIARYPRLRQPTLLIWCRADRVVPLAVGQRLASSLPRARLEVLDGCRHVPPEQASAETERLIGSFLGLKSGLKSLQ